MIDEAPPPALQRGLRDDPAYLPISAYGIIGDMRTAALVGLNGSIDWCCFPDFPSQSTFAAILDSALGGRFRIAPAEHHTTEQRYLPATNVLVTTFHGDSGGVMETCDFMPVDSSGRRGAFAEIHRQVKCTRGSMDVVVQFQPRLNYASTPTRLVGRRNGVLATDDEDEALALSAPLDVWWHIEEGCATANLRLECDDTASFVLRYDDDEVLPISDYRSDERLHQTVAFWDAWVSQIRYRGAHRALVERSALTLKLLCYEPTGAIVAAPTTSLPEEIGGSRNWDYRFTWLRDSAFTLDALQAIGQLGEASAFMRFLRRITRKATDAHLQIMYGVDGSRDLRERTLPQMKGYRESAPVRIGNGAHDQLQLDVYGEILATAFLWSRTESVGEGTWTSLSRLVDWVASNWRRRDSGIWEVRAGAQDYVMSKVMCWVALDRGVRMAQEFELPADVERWSTERDAVWNEVMERGWSETKASFVQYYGSEALDAANLVIPMVGFLPPDHPRVKGTIAATLRELTSDDRELVYRYRNDDGLEGGEGVFSICTFWLAQALVLSGETEQGERIFQRMLKHANHLGLYSEELDPATGAFLGNFPQGFTHIALINCAHALSEAGRG
ncbi:MAG: glycoside hydrolase family 15 protein [Gemmatimonadaceae bacterium]